MANNRTVVGVDVGGTFTDVFFLNETDGSCNVAKVPSTRRDQSVGIRDGIAQRFDNLSEVSLIIHGTTVGTNALLERKGAKTGIITTSGFRDVIEMRRRDRPETWGLWGMFEPVVSRDLRLEVNERVLADGTIHTVVNETEVVEAATTANITLSSDLQNGDTIDFLSNNEQCHQQRTKGKNGPTLHDQ